MKKLLIAVTAISCLGSAVAVAQPAKTEKQAKNAVQFRQSLLQLVRSNVGVLGAMAKGVVPYDTAVMEKNGMRLEQLSMMLEDYFKTDTTAFKLETDALDEIWQNGDDFSSKAQALTTAAQELQAVAKAGDESKYKAALGGIFKTCKGCHDSYKAE